MHSQTVGVIGAGVMGRGVAQTLASAAHDVVLIDISEDVLTAAQQEIHQALRFQQFFQKKADKPLASSNASGGVAIATKAPNTTAQALDRITFSTDYTALKNVDFVVENVVEKWPIKQEVYAQLDQVCPSHAVFAANTSAISITRIASATQRADRVLGMHFMNPVPLKPAVEVIQGYHTSEDTLNTAQTLLASMGKEGIVVNDSPGFVSNRVLMLTINEAIFLLQDGVASAKDVDKIFKTCFGHKMGPLETADLIGLDTILFSIEVLYESFNDSKYRPCPLLKKMVDAGLYGRKNSKGFYDYP